MLRVRAEKKHFKREQREKGKLWREVRDRALKEILQSKSSTSVQPKSSTSLSSTIQKYTYVPIVSTNQDHDADKCPLSMSFDFISSSSDHSSSSSSASDNSDLSDDSESGSSSPMSKPVARYFKLTYAARLNRMRKQLYRKNESVYDWILRVRQMKDIEGGWSWSKYCAILFRCYQGDRSTVTSNPYSGYWALRLEKTQPDVLRDPDAAELAMILHFDYFGVRRWVREFTLSKQPSGVSCEDWIFSLKRTAERAIVWAPGIISDLEQVAAIAFDGFTNIFARKQKVNALRIRSRYRPVTITWEMVEKIAVRADLVAAEFSTGTSTSRKPVRSLTTGC